MSRLWNHPPHDLDCCLDRAALLTQEGGFAQLTIPKVPLGVLLILRIDSAQTSTKFSRGASMKKTSVWIAFLSCMFFASNGFGQVGINATLSGTISDSSGALIPGVTVTATNEATGVESTALTNESGIYRYPSLQPGNYDVKATLSGFQEKKIKLTLGTSAQIRQNFTLPVGGANTTVDVSVASDEFERRGTQHD
jgi:hypothetical protein